MTSPDDDKKLLIALIEAVGKGAVERTPRIQARLDRLAMLTPEELADEVEQLVILQVVPKILEVKRHEPDRAKRLAQSIIAALSNVELPVVPANTADVTSQSVSGVTSRGRKANQLIRDYLVLQTIPGNKPEPFATLLAMVRKTDPGMTENGMYQYLGRLMKQGLIDRPSEGYYLRLPKGTARFEAIPDELSKLGEELPKV